MFVTEFDDSHNQINRQEHDEVPDLLPLKNKMQNLRRFCFLFIDEEANSEFRTKKELGYLNMPDDGSKQVTLNMLNMMKIECVR